ncbi:MAG: hypothetical protein SFX73_14860 [Kofleriaceae bacterium]|nr:hypothetical protein [Kofleriaceae bacterium]
MTRRATHLSVHSLPFLLALSACGDDAATQAPDGGGERPGEAILVAERFTTPDGRAMYLGAFPGMPSTTVDIAQLTELGSDGDVFACGDDAFFFDAEALAITKYSVGDDLQLTKGTTIQVGQEGITGWTGAHVCASPTRAFIFEGAGGRVVEWNPETMVIVDAFDLPRPNVPAEQDVQFFEPYHAGDLAYFPVEAVNWDTLDSSTAILATFDLRDKTMTYSYDARCGSGLSGHLASDGTFYRYQGYHAFFERYAPASTLPEDCVLKVPAGGKQLDATYMRPVGPTHNMFAIDDTTAVALLVDPAATWPGDGEDPWAWWDLPVVPTKVDLETGATSPYTGLTNRAPMNARKLVLDGVGYYQLNSFDAEGDVAQTQLMRLTPTGAEPVFTLAGGDFLTLERLW